MIRLIVYLLSSVEFEAVGYVIFFLQVLSLNNRRGRASLPRSRYGPCLLAVNARAGYFRALLGPGSPLLVPHTASIKHERLPVRAARF